MHIVGQIRLDQNTNDFATLDVELCKNHLLLVGNDEGFREQPNSPRAALAFISVHQRSAWFFISEY
jgi:hypothetical protein